MSTKTAAEIVAEVTLANYGPGADADLYGMTQRDTETADPSTAQLLDSAALHRDLLGDGVRALMIAAIDADRAQRPAPEQTAAEMLAAIAVLQSRVWGACPELVVETVTDDGETYQALRCPTCGHLVDDGDSLYGVDVSERWSSAMPDHEHEEFDMSHGDDDYGSTLYYLHDVGVQPHPVVPPAGWGECWR